MVQAVISSRDGASRGPPGLTRSATRTQVTSKHINFAASQAAGNENMALNGDRRGNARSTLYSG